MINIFSQAVAAEAPAAGHTGSSPVLPQVLLLAGFVIIFWLLIWRPQSKRAKAHKNLINSLEKGDEVVTSGGIMGKVCDVSDDYITLRVSGDVELHFQRSCVSSTLPKGTLKGLK